MSNYDRKENRAQKRRRGPRLCRSRLERSVADLVAMTPDLRSLRLNASDIRFAGPVSSYDGQPVSDGSEHARSPKHEPLTLNMLVSTEGLLTSIKLGGLPGSQSLKKKSGPTRV